MKKLTVSAIMMAMLALAGCGGSTPSNDSGNTQADVQGNDAATNPSDTGSSTDDAAQCLSTVPPATSQYCAMNGCPFQPVTLPSCDTGGGNYDFYNQDYCSTQVTVLVVAAGWCVPCQMEAPMIEQLITSNPRYAGRVRVISVLAQNPDSSAPTPAFCRTWQNRYGLTSHMLIDPLGLTQVYFPNMAFPANIVIDQNGSIYDRLYGEERGLGSLTADVDALLGLQ